MFCTLIYKTLLLNVLKTIPAGQFRSNRQFIPAEYVDTVNSLVFVSYYKYNKLEVMVTVKSDENCRIKIDL